MADDAISAVPNTAEFRRAMAEFPNELASELKPRIASYLRKWTSAFIRKQFDGDPLHARTGAMRRAFGSTVHGSTLRDLTWLTGSVRAPVPYILIQEFGGVVKPVRAKWLTIPTDAAKTGAGVLKQPARAWPDTFFRPVGKDTLLMFQKRKGPPLLLFVLKKEVTLKPRLGFRDGFRDQIPKLLAEFQAGAKAVLARG